MADSTQQGAASISTGCGSGYRYGTPFAKLQESQQAADGVEWPSGAAHMVMSSNLEDAISAAVGLARDHGITVEKPVPLRSTNNAVAWLYPAPIVAKVGTGRNSQLHTELKVAQELTALGAPVVHPIDELGYDLPINPRLLWVCQGMVSVKTAMLCWADVERGNFREHAEWHLSQVKTRIAPQLLNVR